MANGSTADKARKARNKADDAKYMWGDSQRLANKIAKTATGKELTYDEQSRAGAIIQNRRMNDTGRTAARASFMERRAEKKSATDRMNAAVGGGPARKATAKPVAKAKSAAKTTAPAKKATPAKPKAGLPKEGRQNMSKPSTTKAPAKKKVQVMPNKISPSKMTPAQKARYLKNPERYDY